MALRDEYLRHLLAENDEAARAVLAAFSPDLAAEALRLREALREFTVLPVAPGNPDWALVHPDKVLVARAALNPEAE